MGSTMTRGRNCAELLDEKARFSALFSCNDDMALKRQRRCIRRGRIPQDVSLFGFDDAPARNGWSRGLSTVYLPIDNMITTAIDQRSLCQSAADKTIRRLPARWCFASVTTDLFK